MTPLVISVLAFAGVSAVVGLLAFVLQGNGSKVIDRLDTLTGRKKKDDETTNILKKSAYDRDKKSLLEALTPNLPSLSKIIVQADVHIRTSTLFGIGLVLGVLGSTASWMMGVKPYLAPIAGIVMLSIPFFWLLTKRALRLKKFSSQLPDALELVARALRAGHSLAAGM